MDERAFIGQLIFMKTYLWQCSIYIYIYKHFCEQLCPFDIWLFLDRKTLLKKIILWKCIWSRVNGWKGWKGWEIGIFLPTFIWEGWNSYPFHPLPTPHNLQKTFKCMILKELDFDGFWYYYLCGNPVKSLHLYFRIQFELTVMP